VHKAVDQAPDLPLNIRRRVFLLVPGHGTVITAQGAIRMAGVCRERLALKLDRHRVLELVEIGGVERIVDERGEWLAVDRILRVAHRWPRFWATAGFAGMLPPP